MVQDKSCISCPRQNLLKTRISHLAYPGFDVCHRGMALSAAIEDFAVTVNCGK